MYLPPCEPRTHDRSKQDLLGYHCNATLFTLWVTSAAIIASVLHCVKPLNRNPLSSVPPQGKKKEQKMRRGDT